jgi:hypothetical protein
LSNFGLLFLCNKATALVFSDKKVWYNELSAEIATKNHPPQAASAAVLKDLIMKSWEKNLRAAMNSDLAVAAAAKQNAMWQEFGKHAALYKVGEVLDTFVVEMQTHKCAMSGAKMTKVAATQVVMTRQHRQARNRYSEVLNNLEVTHEIVLTNKQRKVLEPILTADDITWQVWWCYRLRNTGATAVVLRNGNDWMTLYEDGTTSGNRWEAERIQGHTVKLKTIEPSFHGSWFFNKNIKRTYKPTQVVTVVKQDASGAIRIR